MNEAFVCGLVILISNNQLLIIVNELITEKFMVANIDINAQIRKKFTIVAKPNNPSLFFFVLIQM